MSSNPKASPDTLSETQQQLLSNAKQLQDAQKTLMDKYAATTDPAEKKKLVNEIDKNEMLISNLLSSTGKIALVQNQAITDVRNSAKDMTVITSVMDAQLKDVRDQMDAINTSRSEKERMIELNTYYGKRFMAQSGVMKIFIYMCIPVLVLAVLANMGFLPNYIAGFMIIAAIVIGVIYIYYAVHDINRRDKMNFDEYAWEFDPSRVGPLNPGHGGKHKKKQTDSNASMSGCSNDTCCAPPTTWDATSNKCIFVNDAQGDGSAVKGTASHKVGAASIAHAAGSTSLLGDLSSTATTVTPTATTATTVTPTATTAATTVTPTATTGPPTITSNLCWSTANRALTGRCLGDWTYDSAADTCTPPAGSAASTILGCAYRVNAMHALDHNGFADFITTCQVKDSPNCTTEPTFTSCWTNANRAKQGECMGGWTYDIATDSCYADAGSVASQTPGCGSYKVSDMIAKSQDDWVSFATTCKVGGQYDLPNCT